MENKNLSLKDLSSISKEVKIHEKSYAKSYILASLFGWTGVNWLYLENKLLAGLRIILTLLSTLAILILLDVIKLNVNPMVLLSIIFINVPVTIAELVVIDKVIYNINTNREKNIVESLRKDDIKWNVKEGVFYEWR